MDKITRIAEVVDAALLKAGNFGYMSACPPDETRCDTGDCNTCWLLHSMKLIKQIVEVK